MLAMSPLFPSLGWEYPMEIGTQQGINMDNWNLDSLVLPNFTTSQAQDDHRDQVIVKRSESSPGSASSADHYCGNVLAKKLNHNASERDRRKKINNLYSTLRDLLPATDHTKKLSIPVTVSRALKYLPELQKQVDDLIHRKDELLSKFAQLQGTKNELFHQEEKPKLNETINKNNNNNSCSISTSKLGDNEITIQISTLDNISLSEVLLKLENDGLVVLDVSSFRSFGGNAFYNIHLRIEGANTLKCEKLNGEVSLFIQRQNMNNQTLLPQYY